MSHYYRYFLHCFRIFFVYHWSVMEHFVCTRVYGRRVSVHVRERISCIRGRVRGAGGLILCCTTLAAIIGATRLELIWMFFERYSPGVSVSQETPETSTPDYPLPPSIPVFPTPPSPPPRPSVPPCGLVNIHRYCVRGIQEYRNLSFPTSIRNHPVLLADCAARVPIRSKTS